MPFLIMMIAVFAIMYFFMIRPQRKRQKELQKFRDSLEPGMEVVTAGGVHGVVKTCDPASSTVTLEIAAGVKIKVEKSSVFGDVKSMQAR